MLDDLKKQTIEELEIAMDNSKDSFESRINHALKLYLDNKEEFYLIELMKMYLKANNMFDKSMILSMLYRLDIKSE